MHGNNNNSMEEFRDRIIIRYLRLKPSYELVTSCARCSSCVISCIKGSSTVAWYDGSYLAVHSNMVVVTANYRLEALGFLVYGSGSEAITGNFGIKVTVTDTKPLANSRTQERV